MVIGAFVSALPLPLVLNALMTPSILAITCGSGLSHSSLENIAFTSEKSLLSFI